MKILRPLQGGKQPAFTTILLLLISYLAYQVLHNMYRLQDQLVQSDAAQTVLETGRQIALELARYIRNNPREDPGRNWARFAQLVQAFGTIDNQLQFVSLEQGDVTVFQAHTSPLLQPRAEPDDGLSPGLVVPERQILHLGTTSVPVVTFTLPFTDQGGVPHTLRVGVRREAVALREQATARVINALLRLTTITIFASFGSAILVIFWIDARDIRRNKQRRAEEHLAYAGVLASGIAHDFRNPMSSLQLDVQMLRREAAKGGNASAARLEHLGERICHITARMEKIFQEFLFLSKPGSGEQARLDVETILRECIAISEPRMEASGVRLETRIGGAPFPVRGYPEALRRALLNLLINAEQHAGENGVVLAILTRRRRTVRIELANTGRAISKADRKRVFELFYTTRPEGTGLGLFLARAAIEQNGGSLRLTRLEGFATCFRVELPLEHEAGKGRSPRRTNQET